METMPDPTTPPPYRHSKKMGEISGWGGDGDPQGGDGYEKCCQDMLEAGVKWLIDNPDCDLKIRSYHDVFGFVESLSDDAKALEATIVGASKNEATGAMVHGVMARLWFIRGNGWDKYCEELIKEEGEPDV